MDMKEALRYAQRAFGPACDAALVALPEGTTFVLHGEAEERIPAAGSCLERALQQPFVDGNITKYSDFFDVRMLAERGYASLAALPIGPGVLCALSRKRNAFDAHLLQPAAEAASLAVENALLAQRLRETERAYKTLSKSISDVVFSLNERGEITSVNSAVAAALGYGARDLLNEPFSKLVYEPDYALLGEALAGGRRGMLVNTELRLLTKANEPKYFSLGVSASGASLNCVLRDIDAARRTLEQGSMFANTIRNSSDAIYSMDAQCFLRTWNRAAEALFGYAEAEALGKDARVLFSDMRELSDEIRLLNEHGSISGMHAQRVKRDGGRVDVVISASAIRDDEGRVTGYLEMAHDMSALKRMEESERERTKLEEKARKLAAENEAKSAFISNVSHELRTPLTSIRGYGEMLHEEEAGRLNAQQKEYLRIITAEAERLTRLINDVLDYSKMDSKKFKLSKRMFDLREIAAKEPCKSLADRKGLYARWSVAADVPQVFCDPQRVEQVLVNLVSNAIKFTERGGVEVSISRKGRNYVLVNVADTGIGVPEEERKKLFRRFYQIQRKGDAKHEGTGLGLAISAQIVRLHGGRIDSLPAPGGGSIFWFTLPIRERSRKQKPQA
jgi:PAS domain S-box-containing protein